MIAGLNCRLPGTFWSAASASMILRSNSATSDLSSRTALFKTMNVFKNVAFGLKIKKWKKADIKNRVAELLELLGLSELESAFRINSPVGSGSAAIARALAPQPSVLLLDEPFGAVDAKIRQELREWLVRLHSDLNVTTLLRNMTRKRRWKFPIAS